MSENKYSENCFIACVLARVCGRCGRGALLSVLVSTVCVDTRPSPGTRDLRLKRMVGTCVEELREQALEKVGMAGLSSVATR